MEEQMENVNAEQNKKKEIRSWIICLAVAIGVALLIRLFVFEIVLVDGPSMQPTLYTDESVFIEKVSKLFGNVNRGQIVIVHYPEKGNEAYVKRLMGLPGDRVQIKDGILFVNGEAMDEPYIKEPMDFDMDEVTVPEDCYFVLGDNRNHSWDSTELGPISKDNMIGHALCVLWPLSNIKGLTNA